MERSNLLIEASKGLCQSAFSVWSELETYGLVFFTFVFIEMKANVFGHIV